MTATSESGETPRPAVPRAAAVYGGAGLIPFVVAAGMVWAVPWTWISPVIFVQLAYGATILSFLGAAHWGLALAGQGTDGDSLAASSWKRLGLSVVPALIGWISLIPALVPNLFDAALLLQMGAFAALFIGDVTATRRGLAPAWYPRLRRPLTAVVVLALGASMLRIIWG